MISVSSILRDLDRRPHALTLVFLSLVTNLYAHTFPFDIDGERRSTGARELPEIHYNYSWYDEPLMGSGRSPVLKPESLLTPTFSLFRRGRPW